MKNIFFTCSMCLLSISAISQEKINVSTISDSVNVVNSNKPVYINTGNPEADQLRYDTEKAKYLQQHPELSKPVSTPTNSTTNESKEDVLSKINQIDSHINSINIKMEYVSNNPEEKEIAEQEGWFEDMKATKERLELRKLELQKLLEQ